MVSTGVMALANLIMLILYLYQFVKLHETPYYLTRARISVTEVVENESFTIS